MTLYEQIETYGLEARGKKHLLKHLDGQKLSRKEAMEAQCFSCMGYFVDGRADCRIPQCPLYAYRPFKDTAKSQKKAIELSSGVRNELKKTKAIQVATQTLKRQKTPVLGNSAVYDELMQIVKGNRSPKVTKSVKIRK